MLQRFLFIIFCLTWFTAKSQDLDWVKGFSADSSANIWHIEITPENDIISLGFARGELHDIGETGNSTYNSFLVKHNAAGNELWKMIPLADSFAYLNGFKIDAAGNIYIIGEYCRNIILGKDTFTSDSTVAFIAKYNSNRELLWFYKSNGISFYDLRLSPENDVIIHCYTKNNKSQIGSLNGIEEYIMEYKRNFGFVSFSSDGELNWAKFYGGDIFYYIGGTPYWQVNRNGIYCLSYIDGNIDIATGSGKTTIVDNDTSDFWNRNFFLAKYSLNGNLEWYNEIARNSAGGQIYNGMQYVNFDLDDDGNIYLVGVFQGKTDFDFTAKEYILNPLGRGANDVHFIAKYDSALNFKWVAQTGISNSISSWNRIAVKTYKQNIYLYGLYSMGMDIDPGEQKLKSKTAANHFFAEYDMQGKFLSARFLGGLDELYNNKEIIDFELDDHKNIYTCGVYDEYYNIKSHFDFDPSEDSVFIPSTSKYWSGYLARYQTCKKPVQIIPQYETTNCHERLTTLYAQNDHFPVKWYDENNNLLHEGITYTLPQINYATKIWAEDGCNYRDEIDITRQNRWPNIQKIYPNPASKNITINLEGISTSEINIQLINTLGQVIYTSHKEIKDGFQNIILPLNDVREGIYYLRIWNDCIKQTEKIVVVK